MGGSGIRGAIAHVNAKTLREMNADRDTRTSLVMGLKDWNNHQHWSEFSRTYSKLIFSVARQAGLTEQEAEDVVQETTLTIAKKMDEFEYDPQHCSFKGWLLHCTQLRIMDQFRKRPKMNLRHPANSEFADRTDTMNRIPDPDSLPMERIWEEEWRRNKVEVALLRLKNRLKPEHFQLFYLSVVKNVSVGQVASMLGLTSARVYLIRHRVAKLVKKEIQELGEE